MKVVSGSIESHKDILHDIATKEFFQSLTKEEEKLVSKLLCQDYSEHSPDFLGFISHYWKMSNIIPKNKQIVDVGCNVGFQSLFFKNHHSYIGIDPMEINRRFYSGRSHHYRGHVADHSYFEERNISKDSFCFCVAVPSNEAQQASMEYFDNYYVWYPGWEKAKQFGIK